MSKRCDDRNRLYAMSVYLHSESLGLLLIGNSRYDLLVPALYPERPEFHKRYVYWVFYT
jgi:hypothetical protein